jgi:BMFP domain-containing protein YqiC
MQSENRLFDDFVKVVNGIAGTMAGVGREAESSVRERMREWVGGMDFVSRDEFEAVKAMAAAAREENEALKHRLAELEAVVRKPKPVPSKAEGPVAPKAEKPGKGV